MWLSWLGWFCFGYDIGDGDDFVDKFGDDEFIINMIKIMKMITTMK